MIKKLIKFFIRQLKKLIPDLFDLIVLSYEVGHIKPEQQIYAMIETHFKCDMKEMLINRHQEQNLLDVLGDLITRQ